MRDYSIFKNAWKATHDGLVRKDGEGETSVYYCVTDVVSLKEHLVGIEFDENNKILRAKCDCTIASIKCKHLPLCSHIMAACNAAVSEYGKPKRVVDVVESR